MEGVVHQASVLLQTTVSNVSRLSRRVNVSGLAGVFGPVLAIGSGVDRRVQVAPVGRVVRGWKTCSK
jgi:hypothetical protein